MVFSIFEYMTDRESQVLELLSEGLTSREIADKLYISEETVRSHRKRLLSFHKARNTAHLIKITMS